MTSGTKLAILSAFLLTGCAVGPAPAPVSSACATPMAAIIHPSRDDTDLTLRQIDLHNASSRDQCPGIG